MKEPKTNRGQLNAIIKDANKILIQLAQLQQKAQQLADRCREFGEKNDNDVFLTELEELAQTAEDLACFDLEDSIPEPARHNF